MAVSDDDEGTTVIDRTRLRARARRTVQSALSVTTLVARALVFAAVERVFPASRRDGSLWVFGARGGDGFVDNPKYLFLHVANERPAVRAVWLSKDDDVVIALRERGYEAYHAYSPRGVALSLRAGVVVLSQGLRDVNLAASGGATIVQLWHGIPLKHVAWDAEIPTRSAPERLVHSYLLGKTSVVAVTASELIDVFASAFRIDPDRVVVMGYPRLDALFGQVVGEDVSSDDATTEAVRRVTADHPVVAYLPTYRDAARDRASTRLDFDAIGRYLEEIDAYLLVKFHPFEEVDPAVSEHERLIHVPSASDVYPLLRHVDLLVTDYSSVAFDFLLLDRPIVYYPYDFERYSRERRFYVDYGSVTPGPRATEFPELLRSIEAALERDEFADRRREVRDRFFDHVGDGQAALVYRAIRDLHRPYR